LSLDAEANSMLINSSDGEAARKMSCSGLSWAALAGDTSAVWNIWDASFKRRR